MVADGAMDITVDVSDTCATSVVSTEIVAVVDSDGVTCAVFVSLAWANSCGNNKSHRNKRPVIKPDLIISLLIPFPPCRLYV